MSHPSFTPDEQARLAPFFTNLDRDVFGLKLPQEVAGALFSRYSRSAKSLRDVFLEEFAGDAAAYRPAEGRTDGEDGASVKRAREFYDRVLIGYGDDSVAQLGGAHLACENISNVAANVIEDARIGIAPLEKSTRYVRFDRKDAQGRDPVYDEPTIIASPHAGKYRALMALLFDTYARQMEPMLVHVERSMPVETMEFTHPSTGEPVRYGELAYGTDRQWADRAYRATVRAHACDLLRGYLPMATRTNVGLFGVGQAFEHLLNKSSSSPLAEMRGLAGAMHRELNELIPSFVKRARPNPYWQQSSAAVRAQAERIEPVAAAPAPSGSTLVEFDPQAEEKVLAALLYPHTHQPLAALRERVRGMDRDARSRLLADALGGRRNRRDKPGRALEQAVYTFDLCCNIGSYRDLHRHRIVTKDRQSFTVEHGYDMPEELAECGFDVDFRRAMEEAASVHRLIARDHPLEAQYVVPFAYRVRWMMTVNLRELYHIVELRTMPQGHPDYRRLAQELWRQVEAVHPSLAEHATFVNRGAYRLGRLHAELRTEYKRSVTPGLPGASGRA
ncbi:MAG TPA: FAD-dependent thymidylate synthase [Nitrospiria bacterium]|nr:FAD-dependent thymidylate synthase [Nitrospiria bacterium]